MFERFNEHARRSLFFARYEASRSSSRAIGTEHLLLGMLREADEAMSELFLSLNVSLPQLRTELLRELPTPERATPSPDLPLAEDTKRALAFAVHEAESMGHSSVGTDHLLLGLLRLEYTTAAQYLQTHGFEVHTLREEVGRRWRERGA